MRGVAPITEEVRFASGDGQCAATLYWPPGRPADDPLPVVVLAHGLGGVKDERLDAYAARFVEAGYAAMAFDYRYFGASTGEPRNLVDTREQAEDFRSAVAHVRSLDGIDPDRVVVWGTSLGAGHALATAAQDPRLAAVIAQAPFSDGLTAMRSIPRKAVLRMLPLALRDKLAAVRGRAPVLVPIVGAPGDVAVMTSPDSVPGLRRILEASGKRYEVPLIPARFVFQIPFYRPGRNSTQVRAPLLVCVCERDQVTPAATTEKVAARAPRGEVKRYDADHFAIYTGELWESVVTDQVAFLEKHVPLSPVHFTPRDQRPQGKSRR